MGCSPQPGLKMWHLTALSRLWLLGSLALADAKRDAVCSMSLSDCFWWSGSITALSAHQNTALMYEPSLGEDLPPVEWLANTMKISMRHQQALDKPVCNPQVKLQSMENPCLIAYVEMSAEQVPLQPTTGTHLQEAVG